eukprot:1148682-Pelagomonas_calceolata.AAC.3
MNSAPLTLRWPMYLTPRTQRGRCMNFPRNNVPPSTCTMHAPLLSCHSAPHVRIQAPSCRKTCSSLAPCADPQECMHVVRAERELAAGVRVCVAGASSSPVLPLIYVDWADGESSQDYLQEQGRGDAQCALLSDLESCVG